MRRDDVVICHVFSVKRRNVWTVFAGGNYCERERRKDDKPLFNKECFNGCRGKKLIAIRESFA